MADVVAVLVVPAEGDPGGLLSPGRCGSSLGGGPPCAELYGVWCGAYDAMRETASDQWSGEPTEAPKAIALPLWWDGALVPEGWDRARRVHRATGWETSIKANPTCSQAISLARDLVAALGGRVVRLARVDGRLVEVGITSG